MLDLSKLHKQPWTRNNNPTGWIEVTTYCQLKCPGCYRECNQGCHAEHKPLEEIKQDIDRFVLERNIQHISIAGGEPLMYPYLKEVVSYAKSKGVGSYIITNGILLDRNKILELQKAGNSKFVVHIDASQGHKDSNGFRKRICKLFRGIKDTKFGFIMPIFFENYNDVSDLIDICKKNTDVVECLTLSFYQNISLDDDNQMTRANDLDAIDFICKKFKSKPCAYLGKIINKDKPSWLYVCPIFKDNKFVRYLNTKEYRDFWNKIFLRNEKDPSNYWNKIFLENKKGSSNYSTLEDGSNVLNVQIIISPQKINGKYDLCDGCPDAMYYKGKLVPSCLLERIKKGEKIEI